MAVAEDVVEGPSNVYMKMKEMKLNGYVCTVNDIPINTSMHTHYPKYCMGFVFVVLVVALLLFFEPKRKIISHTNK